jgi:hypothetical protein
MVRRAACGGEEVDALRLALRRGGVVLSVFLIAAGNSGGWVLLVLTICIYGAVHLFVGNIKPKQPR